MECPPNKIAKRETVLSGTVLSLLLFKAGPNLLNKGWMGASLLVPLLMESRCIWFRFPECGLQVFRGAGECWSVVTDLRTWGHWVGIWGEVCLYLSWCLGRKCSGGIFFFLAPFNSFGVLVHFTSGPYPVTNSEVLVIHSLVGSGFWAWECLSLFWCSGGWDGKTDLVLVCLQIIK